MYLKYILQTEDSLAQGQIANLFMKIQRLAFIQRISGSIGKKLFILSVARQTFISTQILSATFKHWQGLNSRNCASEAWNKPVHHHHHYHPWESTRILVEANTSQWISAIGFSAFHRNLNPVAACLMSIVEKRLHIWTRLQRSFNTWNDGMKTNQN